MTRALIITLIFVAIFTIFTTVFAVSANKSEVRLLPKWVWVLICLIPFFGGLLYLMVGRPLRPKSGGAAGTKKVVAPDDDPNFLRDLSKKIKPKDDDDKGEQPK